jgi:RNA polymerase sigma-70 factor (ECF subfamily)
MAESKPNSRHQRAPVPDGPRQASEQMLEAFRGYLLTVAVEEVPADLRASCSASDLVQETFLAAHQHFGQFRGTTVAELRGWLRQILRNKLISLRRRHGKRPTPPPPVAALADGSSSADWTAGLAAPGPSPSDVVNSREQAQTVHAVLDRLPENYRQTLLWHLQDELSFEEIGRRLGLTENAAGKLFRRAVRKVRQLMETPS